MVIFSYYGTMFTQLKWYSMYIQIPVHWLYAHILCYYGHAYPGDYVSMLGFCTWFIYCVTRNIICRQIYILLYTMLAWIYVNRFIYYGYMYAGSYTCTLLLWTCIYTWSHISDPLVYFHFFVAPLNANLAFSADIDRLWNIAIFIPLIYLL